MERLKNELLDKSLILDNNYHKNNDFFISKTNTNRYYDIYHLNLLTTNQVNSLELDKIKYIFTYGDFSIISFNENIMSNTDNILSSKISSSVIFVDLIKIVAVLNGNYSDYFDSYTYISLGDANYRFSTYPNSSFNANSSKSRIKALRGIINYILNQDNFDELIKYGLNFEELSKFEKAKLTSAISVKEEVNIKRKRLWLLKEKKEEERNFQPTN